MSGRIYLVGAGPGDPGLLTRRGERCLAVADVVVHDRLVGPRLLDLVRPGAEVIALGRSHDDRRERSGLLIEADLIDRADDVTVAILDRVPFLDRRWLVLERVVRGPDRHEVRVRRKSVPERRGETARGRDEGMLLEDRLLFELVLVDSQDERVTLAIGCEVVFAHDHLATEQAAGAHDESGDATAGGVDEHPSHRARVVPVAGPNLGVQLHAHVTPPSPVSSGRSAGPRSS